MLNKKGQFSIIAALLVAVVLVASVMATYSSIRYNTFSEQPQILNAVDETNLGLKGILGFTVGYYGSVLKVTGNQTYALQLASKYLQSGLDQTGDVRPEWAVSVNLTSLALKTSWFSNKSYSQGSMAVTYNLAGLGISGVSYDASTRLDVEVMKSNQTGQAQLKILMDENQPLINLGKNNLKFFRYEYNISDWKPIEPVNIASYADGTYVLDLPQGISPDSYVIQVEDTRGLMVIASSYSQFTSKLTFNTSSYRQAFDYVGINSTDTRGTHGNFTAQQFGPDGIYDALTEAAQGTTFVPSYPTSWTNLGLTTSVGDTSKLTVNDGVHMVLGSYGSSPSNQTLYAHQETSNLNGYSSFKLASADQSGQTLSVSAKNSGRQLIGKFVFQLSGISSIPASSGTIYYRACRDSSTAGYCVADFTIRQSSGALRFTLATNTAGTGAGSLTTSWATLSGNYSIGTYNVVDQTDYLEIDYYMNVTTTRNGASMYLDIDDNNLAQALQTRVTGINLPSVYSVQTEFTGQSIVSLPNNSTWTVDGSASTTGVNATYKLFNWTSGQYQNIGDGYMNTLVVTSDTTMQQVIINSPQSFLNSSGAWKVMVTAVLPGYFGLNLDFVQVIPDAPNYALNLQEQWLTVNATNIRQDLCIKTGALSANESLLVQVYNGGVWKNLTTLLPNCFNNVSLAQYIDSTNLTIRFVGGNDNADPNLDSWNIDAVYIKDEPDVSFLLNLQQSAFTLETMQNGTMRWLGQNIQNTTQTLPIPPVPVKAIHVNQTINGVNQEVPFQIEDWASSYQIPLGLTSNTTVFGNRQMIVFLLRSQVSEFTVWWDGTDSASQTSLAYTNRYFTDTPSSQTLNNGKLGLKFATTGFVLTSTVGTVTSTSNLMRFNNTQDSTDPELAYVITNGTVRDLVLGEAEYSGGIPGCPNTYTNIIISLPANVTYYTYRLRSMFIDSAGRARAFSDLCPVRVTTNASPTQLQTENGTLGGFPSIQNGTGTFTNTTSGNWTAHHFSQLITDTGKGVGIMFTDINNQKLYAFDSFASSTSKGALIASSGLIELLPVSQPQVSFTYAYDITWQGAVATFDGGNTPTCNLYDSTTPMGLWLLAEYPPTLTVTPKS